MREMTTHKHKGPVTCIDVSGDANRLLTGSTDKTIKVWDISTAVSSTVTIGGGWGSASL